MVAGLSIVRACVWRGLFVHLLDAETPKQMATHLPEANERERLKAISCKQPACKHDEGGSIDQVSDGGAMFISPRCVQSELSTPQFHRDNRQDVGTRRRNESLRSLRKCIHCKLQGTTIVMSTSVFPYVILEIW